MRDILIFVGAGASRAANPLYPLITDFLSTAIKIVTETLDSPSLTASQVKSTKPFWQFIREGMDHGFFKLNEILIQSYYPNMEVNWEASNVTDFPVNKMKSQLASARSQNPFGIHCHNFEKIVETAQKNLRVGSNDAMVALRLFLVWLFSEVERRATPAIVDTPHSKMIAKLNQNGLLSRTIFVSFNYDLLLERAIQSHETPEYVYWSPYSGFGFTPPGYFSVTDHVFKSGRITPEENKSLILKPHGSLGWIENEGSVCPIVNDSSALSVPSRVPNTNELCELFLSSTRTPFIIPPGPIKRHFGRHSFRTWNIIKNAISHEAKKIVVIGWNIPDSDNDVFNRLIRYSDLRPDDRQLDRLIVCDKREEDHFYDKYGQIFIPLRPTVALKRGFEWDAEEIVENLINPAES